MKSPVLTMPPPLSSAAGSEQRWRGSGGDATARWRGPAAWRCRARRGWRRKAHEQVHGVDGGGSMVLDGRASTGMGAPPASSIDTPSRSRLYSFLNEKISRRSKAPLGCSSVQRQKEAGNNYGGHSVPGCGLRLRRRVLFAAPIPSDPALSLSNLVLRRAAACPSAPALVDAATGRALTSEALRSTVLATAAALSTRALVRRGDVVLLLLAPNSVLYPVCFLAFTALGVVATTANPLYTTREIAKQVADARVVLVVTVSDILPKIADLRLPTILLDGDDAYVPSDHASNVTLYSDLVASVQERSRRCAGG